MSTTNRPILLTVRARERAAEQTLAQLARFAGVALAQMRRYTSQGERVRALIWLDIRLHVTAAIRRVKQWIATGVLG